MKIKNKIILIVEITNLPKKKWITEKQIAQHVANATCNRLYTFYSSYCSKPPSVLVIEPTPQFVQKLVDATRKEEPLCAQ